MLGCPGGRRVGEATMQYGAVGDGRSAGGTATDRGLNLGRDLRRARERACPRLRALSYAHEQQVVHRAGP